MRRLLPLLILPLLAAAAMAQATAPAPLPAAADIRRQVDAGQYRESLKGLLRVLDLKGPAAAPYDRLEMLLLRAECQLQIRETRSAQDSLDLVQKEAIAKGDIESAGKALAFSLLITKSPGMTYTPRTRTGAVTPKPVSILDRATRPDAYKALFADLYPDARQKVHAGASATTVDQLVDAARSAATLRAVEKAATGDVRQTRELAGELANHASVLLSNALLQMSSTVQAIASAANQTYSVPVQRVNPVSGTGYLDAQVRRRGLFDADIATLRQVQQHTTVVISATGELSAALGDNTEFGDCARSAADLRQSAENLLRDNFSRPLQR